MVVDLARLETELDRVSRTRQLPPPPVRRLLREQSGLSITNLADVLGVADVSVGRWERGVCDPSGDLLAAYLEVLGRLAEFTSRPNAIPRTGNAALGEARRGPTHEVAPHATSTT